MPKLVLLAALGILGFLLISNTFDFRDNLFAKLFPKPPSQAAQEVKSVPGEILLKFKPGTKDDEKEKVKNAHGLKEVEKIDAIEVHLMKVPEQARDKVIEALKHNPNIEFAEPNFIGEQQDVPNDNSFPSQWGLKKIQARFAWDISTGSANVKIAVIDDGLLDTHEDLAGRIVPGYNYLDNNTNTSTPSAQVWHGTGVASVAGAATNNAKGMAGMDRNSPLMPIRVCKNGGCSYSRIANGIKYAADHGALVINMSLGGTASSSALLNAVNYAWGRGAVLVASSGNYGTNQVLYPARYPNVIAAGGSDGNDARPLNTSVTPNVYWTNYGPDLDVVAPVSSIVACSATCTTVNGTSVCTADNSCYGNGSGTSYSAPLVSGLTALIWSVNPNLSNQQVVDIIRQTADKIPFVDGVASESTYKEPYKSEKWPVDSRACNGWNQYFGCGRIDANAALVCARDVRPATKTEAIRCPYPIPDDPGAGDNDKDGTINADDCQPDNPDVKLNQDKYFSVPYTKLDGNTSWDYNCSGREDKKYQIVSTMTSSPACYRGYRGGSGGWVRSPVPACGESALTRICTGFYQVNSCTGSSCTVGNEGCPITSCGNTAIISWSISDSQRTQQCH